MPAAPYTLLVRRPGGVLAAGARRGPWSRHRCAGALLLGLVLAGSAAPASAAHGPLGIDSPHAADDSGIWSRGDQLWLQGLTLTVVIGGALWEGSDSRLGHTYWESIDAVAIGAVTAQVMKVTFSRARPSQTDDPNLWFQGHGHNSFPSGEVMTVTTAITPFILEYGAEHPAVWALAVLPVYDGIARVKSKGHWPSDVIASMAIGSAIGLYSHNRLLPISVGVLPRGVTIGWKTTF
jgi:undecaprenyl-diphosphatase